jgi:uncharacterized protein (DUF1499 family)
MDPNFPDCPETPNCVSSLAREPARRVDPFPVIGTPARSMEILVSVIRSLPRSDVASSSAQRIEARFRSLMGFVDDLLIVHFPEGDMIHVRSASRKGRWDLGVNRRRVERIRKRYLGLHDQTD